MNRAEALDKADELVTFWMEQVKNQRGHVADGWKPADPTLRTDAVLRLAEFLMQPEPPRLVAAGRSLPPHPTCKDVGLPGQPSWLCGLSCPPSPPAPPT